MGIQILQYEFLGPIKLDEWGPPMEKTIYVILSRKKDAFNIIYVGDCQKTNENGFFTQNPNFKCWINKSGNEQSLYLAIYPMFDSVSEQRNQVISKIISKYNPSCNIEEIPQKKSDYVIRSKENSDEKYTPSEIVLSNCPCCGSKMKVDKVLERSTIIRCTECGLSDTRLNS